MASPDDSAYERKLNRGLMLRWSTSADRAGCTVASCLSPLCPVMETEGQETEFALRFFERQTDDFFYVGSSTNFLCVDTYPPQESPESAAERVVALVYFLPAEVAFERDAVRVPRVVACRPAYRKRGGAEDIMKALFEIVNARRWCHARVVACRPAYRKSGGREDIMKALFEMVNARYCTWIIFRFSQLRQRWPDRTHGYEYAIDMGHGLVSYSATLWPPEPEPAPCQATLMDLSALERLVDAPRATIEIFVGVPAFFVLETRGVPPRVVAAAALPWYASGKTATSLLRDGVEDADTGWAEETVDAPQASSRRAPCAAGSLTHELAVPAPLTSRYEHPSAWWTAIPSVPRFLELLGATYAGLRVVASSRRGTSAATPSSAFPAAPSPSSRSGFAPAIRRGGACGAPSRRAGAATAGLRDVGRAEERVCRRGCGSGGAAARRDVVPEEKRGVDDESDHPEGLHEGTMECGDQPPDSSDAGPKMPQELIDSFLEFMDDDTLKSCSLVARCFLQTSQKHIFSSITLMPLARSSTVPDRVILERLHQTFLRSPHLALYVRSLYLVGEADSDPPLWMGVSVFPAILAMLSNLVRIYMDLCWQPWLRLPTNLQDAFRAAMSLPSFRSIKIEQAAFTGCKELFSVLRCCKSVTSVMLSDVLVNPFDDCTADASIPLALLSLGLVPISEPLTQTVMRVMDLSHLCYLRIGFDGPEQEACAQRIVDCAATVRRLNLHFPHTSHTALTVDISGLTALDTLKMSAFVGYGVFPDTSGTSVANTLRCAPKPNSFWLLVLNICLGESGNLPHFFQGAADLESILVEISSLQTVLVWVSWVDELEYGVDRARREVLDAFPILQNKLLHIAITDDLAGTTAIFSP
ncbi:hypothetical protein GGX14DRAFT_654353 [Mycena pura]|uniref:N-acetyltransferase domain-containing protein n=1 Tax=Mycena pura TaxID=153505 RepID=A0AAD6V409_9AGAR|nr:hypothetical protein GGX14DRAFT_654353 [Mycena pura]